MTTYTVAHSTGVTWTTGSLDEAAMLTGWGWDPVPDADRPVGVDCSGAATKADLQAYAAAMLIPDVDGTRAAMEQAITDWHDKESHPWL